MAQVTSRSAGAHIDQKALNIVELSHWLAAALFQFQQYFGKRALVC